MLDYPTTMKIGAERDAKPEIGALCSRAGQSTSTQSGGMNSAREVVLQAGCTVLITDADDSLSWDRAEQQGRGVGFYVDPEPFRQPERYDGTLTFATSGRAADDDERHWRWPLRIRSRILDIFDGSWV
jgi:hypothetical protein